MPALFIAASLAAMDPPRKELPQDFEIQEYQDNKLTLARLCFAMFHLANDFNVDLPEPRTKLDSLEHPLDRHAFIVLHKAYDRYKEDPSLIISPSLFDSQAHEGSKKDFISDDLKHKFEQNDASRLIDLLSFLLVRRSFKALDEYKQLSWFELHLKCYLSKNSVESTKFQVISGYKSKFAKICMAMFDLAPDFAIEIPKPKVRFYHMECPIDQDACSALNSSLVAFRITRDRGCKYVPPYPDKEENQMCSYLKIKVEQGNQLPLFGALGFLLTHKSVLSEDMNLQLEQFKKELKDL